MFPLSSWSSMFCRSGLPFRICLQESKMLQRVSEGRILHPKRPKMFLQTLIVCVWTGSYEIVQDTQIITETKRNKLKIIYLFFALVKSNIDLFREECRWNQQIKQNFDPTEEHPVNYNDSYYLRFVNILIEEYQDFCRDNARLYYQLRSTFVIDIRIHLLGYHAFSIMILGYLQSHLTNLISQILKQQLNNSVQKSILPQSICVMISFTCYNLNYLYFTHQRLYISIRLFLLQMSNADSLYKPHSNNNLDSENQYTGRYLKLFEEQTKNSKIANLLLSYQQKREVENIGFSPPKEANLMSEKLDKPDTYAYFSKDQTKNQIFADLQRMEAEHMKIMSMMEQKPSTNMDRMSEIQKRFQRRSIQEYVPEYSSPTFSNLNFQYNKENRKQDNGNYRKQSIQLELDNKSLFERQNANNLESYYQKPVIPFKNQAFQTTSNNQKQQMIGNFGNYEGQSNLNDIRYSGTYSPSSTEFIIQEESDESKIFQQLPQQSKHQENRNRIEMVSMDYYAPEYKQYPLQSEVNQFEVRNLKNNKPNQKDEKVQKKQTIPSQIQYQIKDKNQTSIQTIQTSFTKTYQTDHNFKNNTSPQRQQNNDNNKIRGNVQYKKEYGNSVQNKYLSYQQPITPNSLEARTAINQKPVLSSVQETIKEKAEEVKLSNQYYPGLERTNKNQVPSKQYQPLHPSILQSLNQKQFIKLNHQSFSKPPVSPKMPAFQSYKSSSTNNFHKSSGLPQINKKLGILSGGTQQNPNIYAPRTIHDYYYNTARQFKIDGTNTNCNQEQNPIRNRINNIPSQHHYLDHKTYNVRPSSEAPRVLSPRQMPALSSYVPTALLSQYTVGNSQHIFKPPFFNSATSYQRVIPSRPLSPCNIPPRPSSYRATSVHNRPLRVISNQFKKQVQFYPTNSSGRTDINLIQRGGSANKKRPQSGISVTSRKK